MRKYYLTTYLVKSRSEPDGIKYSSYIIASNYSEAVQIAKERNLGETIESLLGSDLNVKQSIARPSTIFQRANRAVRVTDFHRDIKKLMHLCCFLLHLNERKGLSAPDCFSDVGLIHQLVHALTINKAELNYDFYTLLTPLKALEANHPEMFFTAAEIKVLNNENLSCVS